jgi:hypothetical protein
MYFVESICVMSEVDGNSVQRYEDNRLWEDIFGLETQMVVKSPKIRGSPLCLPAEAVSKQVSNSLLTTD